MGLTGGIACGKSTLSTELRQAQIPVIDCDLIARQVVELGKPALARIEHEFGPGVLAENGSLDRKALGAEIFGDAAKRKVLGTIMGPAIQREILLQVLREFMRGSSWVVIDAPTLFETKALLPFCSDVIVVACDSQLQLKRLMERDGSTQAEALQRIEAQLSLQQKIDHARTTVVLKNNTSRDQFILKVPPLIQQLQQRAGCTHRLLTMPGILGTVALAFFARWGWGAARL